MQIYENETVAYALTFLLHSFNLFNLPSFVSEIKKLEKLHVLETEKKINLYY